MSSALEPLCVPSSPFNPSFPVGQGQVARVSGPHHLIDHAGVRFQSLPHPKKQPHGRWQC